MLHLATEKHPVIFIALRFTDVQYNFMGSTQYWAFTASVNAFAVNGF